MRSEVFLVDTRKVEARQRLSYWTDAIERWFGSFDLIQHNDMPFSGTMSIHSLGPLAMFRASGDPITIGHSGRTSAAPTADSVQLYLNLAGRCVIGTGEREASLGPGDLLFASDSQPLFMDCYGEERWSHLTLRIPKRLLQSHMGNLSHCEGIQISGQQGAGLLASGFLADLAGILSDASPHPHEAQLGVSALNLVRLLLDQTGSVEDPALSSHHALLQEAKWYIDLHLGDRDLHPRTVAKAHFISERLLYKLFEDEGVGVAGWIRTRRLERCCTDLADPAFKTQTVSGVAARWGFRNPAHFSRLFHEAYGVSPTVFRETSGLGYVDDAA
jgi:AraC-like DNA-binding protein